jgi:adenylate cyclase
MAYGAKDKIMVMMISVADLKRRMDRSRLKRGTSMSMQPILHDDAHFLPARRGRRPKELDTTLQRLEAEVPAPTGLLSIVFTDIKGSTNLWETYPLAMRSAIKLHNDVMRRQLRRIGGFEVKTEGDAFMVSFPTATSALLWCFAVQTSLLEVDWPSEMLNSITCAPVYDKDNNLIFKGLSVRMGVHWGEPLAELDPVTRRMDYYGPMVNKASRISACADGGQITVSSDFISEIQRCLETYQEPPSGATVLDEQFDDDMARSIPNELRSLSSQGFEVKEMGEKKLKGLENPEIVYSLYPHTLIGRIDHHQAFEQAQTSGQASSQAAQQQLANGTEQKRQSSGELDLTRPVTVTTLNPEIIWALWKVSLRLEMLCSSLEQMSGTGLQPPETLLLERMRARRGGDLTDRFLVHFMEHQVSRIEVR